MSRAALGALLFLAHAGLAGAADYSFDLSEIEPAPYETSGFVEARFDHFGLRPQAALYPLSYPTGGGRDALDRASLGGELAGKYQQDSFTAYGRLSVSASTDALGSRATGKVLEAGVRAAVSEALSFDLGKQVQRWGKGYAWNPVGFFERPKDASDPSVSREGFVMASADWVHSLDGGQLKAVGIRPVVLPTAADLNSSYGPGGEWNPGAKLYLLLADTDIDLMWAAEGSRPQRVGLDFSRNLGSQLEVHGEWARALDASRRVLNAAGTVDVEQGHLDSWLLGLRYVTEREVTWIAEYYRNGAGYSESELGLYHRLLLDANGPSGTAALRTQAQVLTQSGYGRPNPGRDYAYVRMSAKDPFDWLYSTLSVTAIANLQDRSWQLSPEWLYTGWQNLELRARLLWLNGGELSEFGAKPARRRYEVYLRLYF